MKKNNKLNYIIVAVVVVLIVAIFMIINININKNTQIPVIEEIPIESQAPLTTDKDVASYFQYKDNAIYNYVSENNESSIDDLLNQQMSIIFRNDNLFQRKTLIPGSILEFDEVFKIEDDTVTFVVGDNKYSHSNFTNNLPPEEDNFIILKGPLEKGATWDVNSYQVSEITDMAAQVSVPYGTFTAMEVITNSLNGDYTKAYYVKNVGLVKTIYSYANQGEHISQLSSVRENTPLISTFIKYNYNAVTDKVEPTAENIEIAFNPDYQEILTKELKTVSKDEYQPLLTENTKINFINITSDYKSLTLDLSDDFIKELNSGANIEQKVIQSLANTVGVYYGVEYVTITIDGKNVEDGHVSFGTLIKVQSAKEATEE